MNAIDVVSNQLDPWSRTFLLYRHGEFILSNKEKVGGTLLFLLSNKPEKRMGISKMNPPIKVRYAPFYVQGYKIEI